MMGSDVINPTYRNNTTCRGHLTFRLSSLDGRCPTIPDPHEVVAVRGVHVAECVRRAGRCVIEVTDEHIVSVKRVVGTEVR
ncbi:MAG: hypothetical protein ACYSW3_09045 [Planctomycetota bacterium]